MQTIKQSRLKRIAEPEYGIILYREKKNPDNYYIAVLCGGIGQYERCLRIGKNRYDELQLGDGEYLKRFAYEVCRGLGGFEEVKIESSW